MGRKPRSEQFDLNRSGTFHLYSRCVRAIFLIGKTGADGSTAAERKQWVEQRQEELFAAYAMDLVGFAVMDNHMHHIIITQPDLAKTWSAEQVIERWYSIHHAYNAAGKIVELTPELFAELAADEKRVAMLRQRLCDPSELMKDLKQRIARRCNDADEKTGKFWDERFHSVELLDFVALLMCLIYVDLNPVRAKMVDAPEDYENVSVHRRVAGRKARTARGDTPADPEHPDADAVLIPIPEDGEPGNRTAPRYRASDRGALPMLDYQYLSTLDWAGRLIRGDKGVIPADAAPILERIGVLVEQWGHALDFYGGLHHTAVGSEASMRAAAASRGQLWFRGVTIAASIAAN